MSTDRSLAQWLEWQERIHPSEIELGLERVAAVHAALGGGRPAPIVITVAGTNGKGSCAALLTSMLRAHGVRVGAFTSPHLLRYNERVQIDGEYASDELLVAQFERIDRARGATQLTFFEFGALTALGAMAAADLDIAILEVGLGGRLDAVNIVDADIALITGIDLDHQDWLGDTLDLIAREKAGIMRARAPVIYGSPDMPDAIVEQADLIGAQLVAVGRDYYFAEQRYCWSWHDGHARIENLPMPGLAGAHQVQNAAACIAVLQRLPVRLQPNTGSIVSGLKGVELAGRLQALSTQPQTLLDVAHNADSVKRLAAYLRENPVGGRTLAVFGALADKHPGELVIIMNGLIDEWFVAPPASHRAPSRQQLEQRVRESVTQGVCAAFTSIDAAYQAALNEARDADRIVVFGSFLTVEEVLRRDIKKKH